MTRRDYPKDARGNTIFPRALRLIEWYRGPWLRRYTPGGFDGYRHLLTGQRIPCATLAAWKWTDQRRARKLRRRRRQMPPEFEALATYNAQCRHGVRHTADYVERMRQLQERFDLWMAEVRETS